MYDPTIIIIKSLYSYPFVVYIFAYIFWVRILYPVRVHLIKYIFFVIMHFISLFSRTRDTLNSRPLRKHENIATAADSPPTEMRCSLP